MDYTRELEKARISIREKIKRTKPFINGESFTAEGMGAEINAFDSDGNALDLSGTISGMIDARQVVVFKKCSDRTYYRNAQIAKPRIDLVKTPQPWVQQLGDWAR